ncbi:hypothetical protein [Streptomyces scopuliridis]|uniref:hypothetical protein n=1 Tax=Streptomyces scopuliridis TaxID=452529 RepID=UPI003680A6A4
MVLLPWQEPTVRGATAMGTSTKWKGPRGDRWTAARRRLARWRPDQRDADRRLEEIAEDHVRALHETLRANPSAFGLLNASGTGGVRLAKVIGSLARTRPDTWDEAVGRLAKEVSGEGGTLADAAVRRAVASAARQTRSRHPDLSPSSYSQAAGGSGFASDILCDLYQLFFANVVAEFLRFVVAEQVKLAIPVLIAADPEGRMADWIAEQLVELVPSPCEETAEVRELTEAVNTAESLGEAAEDSTGALSDIAQRLVPKAVGRVLGLIADEAIEESDSEGDTAA